MKHIKRKITLSVLGTMLLVFASLLAAVNIFIPKYLTAEAQKAILWRMSKSLPSRSPISTAARLMLRSIF